MCAKKKSDFDFMKKNIGDSGECLADQKDKEVHRFDTGVYALNKIISGSYFEGVRSDKMMALAGLPDTGKSFLLANTVRGAQEHNYIPVLFDSERAVSNEYYSRIGVDVNKVLRIPITYSEQLRTLVMKKVYEPLKEDPTRRIFLGLDSVGNLSAKQEIENASKGSESGDMGLRAKSMNSAMRVINHVVTECQLPFVFTNHVYMNPSQVYAKPEQVGGKKIQHNPYVVLYIKRNKIPKHSDIESDNGFTMKITSLKNRETPENQEIELEISFTDGLMKYSGLMDDAKKYGFIERSGTWYEFKDKDGNEIGKVQGRANVKYASELWEQVLPQMDEIVREENSYSVYHDEDIDEASEKDSQEDDDKDEE